WVGHVVGGFFGSFFNNSTLNGTGIIYNGADVTGFTDPSTGLPNQGTYVNLEANNSTWADGDSVQNMNYIAAVYSEENSYPAVYNPFAPREVYTYSLTGDGGALQVAQNANGFEYINNKQPGTTYAGGGGADEMHAPAGIVMDGTFRGGLWMRYSPLFDGTPCSGYILCTEEIYPGATSTIEGIWTGGSYLNFDAGSNNFNMNGGLNLNGGLTGVVGPSYFGGDIQIGVYASDDTRDSSIGFSGYVTQPVSRIGLCQTNAADTDICLFSGSTRSSSAGKPVTPALNLNATSFNNVPLTALGLATNCLSAAGTYVVCGSGGGSGFPITLGATPIAGSSTTTAVTGLSVN